MANTGHLFIINGDVGAIECDAWLLPTDDRFAITRDFESHLVVECLAPSGGRTLLQGVDWQGEGVIMLPPAMCSDRSKESQIWLGRVGVPSVHRTEVDEVLDHFGRRAEEFVRKSSQEARDRTGRRPLVALPAIGSGDAGFRERRGILFRRLVEVLVRAAEANECDVVLVTFGNLAHDAAQTARRELESSLGVEKLWGLSGDDLLLADRLAAQADKGNLVVFLGAGVSAQAGLPDWQRLLDDVATQLGVAELIPELHELDVRDQATVLKTRAEQADLLFEKELQGALESARYSLLHGILSSLPVKEFVTTNFDDLFERAARTAGRSLAVVPGDAVRAGDRWLVKIHGDLARDVVLTRQQYLGITREKGALLGLVQALLLTRHMLFVGYSLRDDDFHELVHEVRSALGERAESEGRFGTVLSLFPNSAFSELWPDLAVHSLGDRGTDEDDIDRRIRETSRRLSILLDRVNAQAASRISFLTESSYKGLGPDRAEELAQAVEALRELHLASGAEGEQWNEIVEFLRKFSDL